MPWFENVISESEVGIREARQQFTTLLNATQTGDQIVHISRHGRRISALVSPDIAESILAVRGNNGPPFPGALNITIKLIEEMLINDDSIRIIPNELPPNRPGIAGACILMIDIILPGSGLGRGEIPCEMKDGSTETKLVAEYLVHRLHRQISEAAHAELPFVVGSLWAAQVHGFATEHRIQIPRAINGREALLWVIALYELCYLINTIHGSGTAEGIMYEIEEKFRADHQTM
ncbi:type II toxin-antitoxin system prevent-host-death family antitoxin [Amycolatopsis sp. NPDC051716]|uniref:type II toxin-antitoxin system Phd/YefM family antitoxin n=1 Tax=Amycolatopsis sp. NPDC051716 TaxID=3155804 RepID=UPI00344019AE